MFKKEKNTTSLDVAFKKYGSDRPYEPEEKNEESQLCDTSKLGNIIRLLLIVVLLMLIAFLGIFGYRYFTKQPEKQQTVEIQHKPIQPKVQVIEKKVIAVIPTPIPKTEKKDVKSVIDKLLHDIDTVKATDNEYVKSLNDKGIDTITKVVTKQIIDTNDVQDIQVQNSENTSEEENNKIFLDNMPALTHMDKVSQIALKIQAIIQASKMEPKKLQALHDNNTPITYSEPYIENTYTESLQEEVKVRKKAMTIIVVKRGDSLSKLAKRAYGEAMLYNVILKANPKLRGNPNRIYVGQRLRIPQ